MERLAKHWNGVPGEVVEPPFLEVLNKQIHCGSYVGIVMFN